MEWRHVWNEPILPRLVAQKSVFPLLAKSSTGEEKLSSLCVSVTQIGRSSAQYAGTLERGLRFRHREYQSECGDHREHERHWVSDHWCRQAGQTPPVSNVFHSLPQVQNHLSPLPGDQPQSGLADARFGEPALFSFSTSRSKTTDDLAMSFKRVEVPVQANSRFCIRVPRARSIRRRRLPHG